MQEKILLLFLFLLFNLPVQAEFLPSTKKLIDQALGTGRADKAQPGNKTLRMKFAKEELWNDRKISRICQQNRKTCPGKETRYQQIFKRQCAREQRSCSKPKTRDQIREQCDGYKKMCLMRRTQAFVARQQSLPAGVPVVRILEGVSPKVKILFRDEQNNRVRFAQARLLIIFEMFLADKKTISSRLLLDANLSDLGFLSARLPPIQLCDNRLNLVTIVLQTNQGLFQTSRAFFIPAACHSYDQ